MIFPTSKSDTKVPIYPLAIFFYLLIVFIPAFYSQSPLLQTDQPLWTTVASLLQSDIFPDQGWFWNVIFDQGGGGQTMGKIYSIPLILPWLFTFFFSAATSVKLATFVSSLLFLLGFYYVAKLFVAEGYALLCTLVILTPMFDNIVSGMWYNYFSLGCGLFFWLCCHHFFRDRSRTSLLCGAFFFALAFYAHPVGIVLCATVLLAYLFLVVVTDDSSKLIVFSCFLLMFCSAILLAFPQIQTILGLDSGPYLLSSGQAIHHSLETTEVLETFRRLFFVRIWGGIEESRINSLLILINMIAIWALVLLGTYSLSVSKNLQKIIPLGLLFVTTAILISRVYNFLNIDIGILRSLSFFYDRFQLLSQIYLVLLAGMGLEFLSRYKSKKIFLKLVYGFLIVNLIFIALRTPKKIYWDNTSQLGTLESSVLSVDVQNLWRWLDSNVRTDEERVYFEDTYGKFIWNDSSSPESFKTHVLALTGVNTDVRQIGGWCGFSSAFARTYEQGTIFGKSLHSPEFTDQFILDRMTALNTKYIVSYTDLVISHLRQVSFLEEAFSSGVFYVFRYSEMKPAWAYHSATGKKAEYIRHSSSHFEVIADGTKGDRVFISMAYHPNYLAKYKEHDVSIANAEQLMSIELPVDGRQSIDFYYTFRKKIALYAVGSGFILLLLTSIGMPRFLRFRKQ